MKKRNILAVVAHPDDEIIGVGGTLAKHVHEGDTVAVLILGDGKSSRQENFTLGLPQKIKMKVHNETALALKTLGIKKYWHADLPDNRFDSLSLLEVIKIIKKYVVLWNPEIVYTHHFGDLNIDHRITSDAAITVCRPIETPSVREIYMFETLSSTEMSGPLPHRQFLPNTFVSIEKYLQKKLQAMKCYSSELRPFPHPRSIKGIELNSKVWGIKNNTEAVEAFYCFRKFIE